MVANRKKTYASPLAQHCHFIDFEEKQAELTHKESIKYTQEALARITPRGKSITVSKEDVFSLILASAKKIERPKDPIIEAIGSLYKPAK